MNHAFRVSVTSAYFFPLVVVLLLLGGCMSSSVESRPVLGALPRAIVVSREFVVGNFRDTASSMSITPGEYILTSQTKKLAFYECKGKTFRCMTSRGEKLMEGGIGYSLVNGRFFTYIIFDSTSQYMNLGSFAVLAPSGKSEPVDWGLVPDEVLTTLTMKD